MSRPAAKAWFVSGLDLGPAQDYTALAVLERTTAPDAGVAYRTLHHYAVRHLRRWPPGTPYTRIAAEVGVLVRTPPLANPLLAIDQTGVGEAVVELFQPLRPFARLRPVLITGGQEAVGYHVPRQELAGTLQVLLQSRRLTIAPLPERDLLARELAAFRVKVRVGASETFEAWRERDHDDLVLAVALAAWLAEQEGVGLIRGEPVPNPLEQRRPFGGEEYPRRVFGR